MAQAADAAGGAGVIVGVWIVVDRHGRPLRGLACQISACRSRAEAEADAARYDRIAAGAANMAPPHRVAAAELRIIEDGASI